MKGILINACTIALGSTIGLLIKNNIPKRITDAVLTAIGLFTVYIGITGLKTGVSSIVYLLALTLGVAVGTALKLEERVEKLGQSLQKKLSRGGEDRFAEGLTGFFIMSCAGAFTIVACFNAGLGDMTGLYTKSAMDFIVSMALAASLGVGVLCAGVPIVLYELILVGFSTALSPLLSETAVEAVSCAGAVLTVAIGLNVAGISRFKILNLVPALVLAPLFAVLLGGIL